MVEGKQLRKEPREKSRGLFFCRIAYKFHQRLDALNSKSSPIFALSARIRITISSHFCGALRLDSMPRLAISRVWITGASISRELGMGFCCDGVCPIWRGYRQFMHWLLAEALLCNLSLCTVKLRWLPSGLCTRLLACICSCKQCTMNDELHR